MSGKYGFKSNNGTIRKVEIFTKIVYNIHVKFFILFYKIIFGEEKTVKKQNEKVVKWVGGLGLLGILLTLPEMLIARTIYSNDPEAFKTCFTIMLLITLGLYLIIATIKIVQYEKFVKEYKRNKIEEAVQGLNSEYRKVFINYSGCISKDMIECKAKVDENGKIICEIFLDMKTTFDTYDEFLRYFHLAENK